MEATVTACKWGVAKFLIFSPNVPAFIYYTHLLPLIVSLILGIFILFNNRKSLANWNLAFITLMFSLWVFFDLILWASPTPEDVMFFWSSIVPIEMLIYASCVYLVSLFANSGRDISLGQKVGIAVFFIPIVFFAHTSYNVLGLSPDCGEGAIEGPLIQYMYVVELIYIVWIGLVAVRGIRRIKERLSRLQLTFVSIGTIFFLLAFTAGNITLVFSFPPNWEQYKLFGMPIFAGFITYCIVRFKAFDGKAIAAEVLVTALAIDTLSLLFLRSISSVRIIASLTFVLVCILGYILVRSVRREIEQRERIELLAKDLEHANQQQVALIHFITHQLKGFVAKSRNIFAMIQEGDYGVVPDTMKPMITEGFSSATKGAQTIQDILNAANIKSGKTTYTMANFDFKALVDGIVKNHKPNADAKGVALTVQEPVGPVMLNGDQMQLENAVKNLVDNTIKYTPKGSITITLTNDGTTVHFMTGDTGVGITPEDMAHLFTEGGHGAESLKVNVDSTGFGLYIVKNIIEGHGGKVWAESEGAGKGSKFIVELPVSGRVQTAPAEIK